MLAVKGVYENGVVKLEEPVEFTKPMPVTVTFLEEESTAEPLRFEDFSFAKTREVTSKYTFSLSEAVIEERREAL